MQQIQPNQGKRVGLIASLESMKYLPSLAPEPRTLNVALPKPLKCDEQRLQAVVETLAVAQSQGEGLSSLAHDARNMVTALGLYCELLEKPGVLSPESRHYANELRLLSAASRRLVEKMVALDSNSAHDLYAEVKNESARFPGAASAARFQYTPSEPIRDLAVELRANRNLLAALAGPSIHLHLLTTGGAEPVRLTGEDLTRILVNLVKNSAEAMPDGGVITIALAEEKSIPQTGANSGNLLLTLSDNGPGIPDDALEAVFVAGFTTRTETDPDSNWPGQHRGLGLSITRSILESNGGAIQVSNRPQGGARFTITLPVNKIGWAAEGNPGTAKSTSSNSGNSQKQAKRSKG